MRVHADGRRGKWWLKLSSLVVAATARRAPDSQTLIARLRALRPRPLCQRDYPPNNGERTEQPSLRIGRPRRPNCSLEKRPQGGSGPSPPEGAPERVRAPLCPTRRTTQALHEVGLFGNAAQSGESSRGREIVGREADGAGDAPRPDVERRRAGPPIDSGVDQRGLGAAKARSRYARERRLLDCGRARASGVLRICAPGRWPVAPIRPALKHGPSESDMCAKSTGE
ncbi:hypothetical protein H5410_063992 [Solanum commersonii]|uniref:Uncharacterized protein n=1 Tax=Solanum commersonii TaxID=4109 RepID=A0A9J5W0S3_SOLCO|nr:hypothetical protein H5410_063992 [Solanum commersonii]